MKSETENRQAKELLSEIVGKKHYNFAGEIADWREALRQACGPLIADGTVTDQYAQDVIDCVEKYGPYIVLFPGVAMPHAQEGSAQVRGTAISFMKTQKPVFFDENNPDSYADLFFTLAAADPNEHLENMKKLMELLTDEALVERLHSVAGVGDLKSLLE